MTGKKFHAILRWERIQLVLPIDVIQRDALNIGEVVGLDEKCENHSDSGRSIDFRRGA